MALHTLKLVDSISVTPTTRLDLNDGTTWICTGFDAPPPRLRRAMSSNAMRDGINVSSANYDARTVKARFRLARSTMDAAATEVQKLARELDKSDNLLMLQFDGASKPVFFELHRSDFSSLGKVEGSANAFELEVELLARPHARGLPESGTVTIDVTASTGLEGSLPATIGDVAVDLRLDFDLVDGRPGPTSSGLSQVYVAAHSRDSAYAAQGIARLTDFASVTMGTNTTRTTGDALYWSGDYAETAFVTLGMTTRLTNLDVPLTSPGLYVAILKVTVPSQANQVTSSVRLFQGYDPSFYPIGPTVDISVPPASAQTFFLNMGTFQLPAGQPGSPSGFTMSTTKFGVQASGLASTSIRFDGLVLVPVAIQGTKASTFSVVSFQLLGTTPMDRVAVVGDQMIVYDAPNTLYDHAQANGGGAWTGSLPQVAPGTSKIFICTAKHLGIQLTDSTVVAWSYYPGYLYVRPSAT